MKKKAIIVDLDGTLANVNHRRHFVENKKNKDWKSFNANILKDELHVWCREIMNRMKTDHTIIIVSGRTDALKADTLIWLQRHDVHFDEIYMRKDKDNRDDRIVKKEIYEKFIKPDYDVLFVLDDRAKVVAMWRAEGLVCLQCDCGDF
jgi:uncharacterized HAD superfamily protein